MSTEQQSISQISIDQVREVLEHIRKREFIELGEHELSDLSIIKSKINPQLAPNSLERGKVVYSILNEILESLRPSSEKPDLNRQDWRCYLLLQEYYFNSKSTVDVSDKVLNLGLVSFYSVKPRAINLFTVALRRSETNFINSQPVPLTNMEFTKPITSTEFFDRKVIGKETSLVEEVIDLLTGKARSGIVALEGSGGVGKTVVAWEIAKRCFERRIFDSIIWTTAKSEMITDPDTLTSLRDNKYYIDSLDGILFTIGKTIGYRKILKLESKDSYEFVLDCLDGDSVLLIIDNLESLGGHDTEEISGFVKELPTMTKVLLTSREKIQGRGEWAIEVSGLDKESSRKMISQEANRLEIPISDNDMEICIELSDGVPLTIQLILSLMHSHGFDPKKAYNDLLDKKAFQKYLFEQVYDNKLTPNDIEVLSILPFFETFASPEEIAAAIGTSTAHAETALGHLVFHSLVKKQVVDNEINLYHTPTAVKGFIKSKSTTAEIDHWSKTYSRLAKYYFDTAKNLSMNERINFLKIHKRNLFSTMDTCYSQKKWECVINLASVFSWTLGELGYIKDRESWATKAIEAANETDQPRLVEWYKITGISYCHLVKDEIDRAKAISLDIYQTTQYPEIKGLALRKLASISLDDDPKKAKTLVEESMIYLSQWNSPDADFWIAITKKLQGIIYSILGDQDKAIQLLKQALEEFEQKDFNLEQEVVIKNLLSLVYARMGDMESAIKTIQENKSFAEENNLQQALAHCYFDYGKIEMIRKNYEEAATLLDESFRMFMKLGRSFYARIVMKSLDQCEEILRSRNQKDNLSPNNNRGEK